ncbi:hypothetical protein ASPVEDRAFT_68355 [Aspergillus versicolor CBS 583.65]|uniref:2EXR domain-containing protein n=1 Tax=Aspergillus versicolor CBS 583.65 TaxID=1036611 RepID=A0A1L9P7Y1_ASPVE|nr:uncharacterized protein ASPVEDRAFT_68355 [Aspergillus versicolor CBS 583.65]OJI97621.1 hypothetical protein ASPVEDRAFT_68355 [Aspergillus versicolor CBS 583.65]
MQTFPRFMDLPPELRLQIWQDARPKPAIHAFDLCIPACAPSHPKESIESFKLARHKSDIAGQIFLDQPIVSRPKTLLPVDTDADTKNQQSSYCSIESALPFDPSAYLVTDSIQQSCLEADWALELPPSSPNRTNTTAFNSVHLPAQGRDKRIWYDNRTEVLLLRFGVLFPSESDILVHNLTTNHYYYTGVLNSNLSNVMEHKWSPQFASTLKNARRLAFDATEITSDCAVLGPPASHLLSRLVKQLSLFLRRDLECLYIVDHCIGRCGKCGKGGLDIGKIAVRTKDGLSKKLNFSEGERSPDVFHGNGVTYREVFALEELGWNEGTTAFLIARTFAETIRKVQKEGYELQKPCFQGVRVLACQEWQSS